MDNVAWFRREGCLFVAGWDMETGLVGFGERPYVREDLCSKRNRTMILNTGLLIQMADCLVELC